MSYPLGKVKKHSLHGKFFQTVAISSRKPPAYTIKDKQVEIMLSVIYQKELINVI